MPSDDFVTKNRQASWLESKVPEYSKMANVPPRFYLDGTTILREVIDLRSLRRGDHCLNAAKLTRALSPCLDRFTSLLSRYEVCALYHHFVLLDDVHELDVAGVPRTVSGDAVRILESSNTIREAIWTWFTLAGHNPLRLPFELCRFLAHYKGPCNILMMADYGDMPALFTPLEPELGDEERSRIVRKAGQLAAAREPYHLFCNNCEHVVNLARRGHATSPEVRYLFEALGFAALRCGLLLLSRRLAGVAFWHLRACRFLYALATASMAAQVLLRFRRAVRSVRWHFDDGMLTAGEAQHLLVKELWRTLLVGTGAVAAVAASPRCFGGGGGPGRALFVCAGSYSFLDAFYSVVVQTVMRHVLLPICGTVWPS